MADAAKAVPTPTKMSGGEIGGRLFALEALVIELTKMLIADPAIPKIDYDAMQARMFAKTDELAKSIGHPEAAATARLTILDYVAALKA